MTKTQIKYFLLYEHTTYLKWYDGNVSVAGGVSDNTVATTSRSLDDMAAVVSRIDRNDNAQRIVFACLFSATKFNLCCSSVAYREV